MGWHTGAVHAEMLKCCPEIFYFLQQYVLKEAERFFPPVAADDVGWLNHEDLVSEPAHGGAVRSLSVEMLKQLGCRRDHSFRAMLPSC